MAINVAEITSILKKEIQGFDQRLQINDVGTVIEVTYLYAFRGGSLVQAVYKGIRSDVEADGAEQLQYKGEERKHL